MEKNKLLRKIEILEFLFELGATEAHECEPINRLKISKEEEKLNKEGDLGKTPEQSVCHSCSNSERSKFAALIENAKTVDELEAICMLSKEFSSSQLSAKMNFSFGNKLAQVMIICEPPGRPEITENVIYSGECGLIFKKMYEAIGLSIKGNNLYVVPVFPWRLSPDPVKAENDMRKFFCCVKKHVSIVRPKVLVLMYKGLDGNECFRIDKNKFNEEYEFHDNLKKFSIETPSRLLESPNEKRAAWETLKQIKENLKKNNE